MNKERKGVIITGGTRGIGKSLIHKFAKMNYDIAFCARNKEECDVLLNEINGMFPNISIYGMPCDISIEAQINLFIEFVKSNICQVDVLINNAGVGVFCDYDELTISDWEKMMTVNLMGPVMMSQKVAKVFFEEKSKGMICNIGSSSVETYVPGNIGYASSKASLKMFSEYLFKEYRPKGIRVSYFSIGSVDTGFSKRYVDNTEWKLNSEEVADTIVKLIECMIITENLCMNNIEMRTMTPMEMRSDKE